MDQLILHINEYLQAIGIGGAWLKPLSAITVILGISLVLYAIYEILNHLVEPAINRITLRTSFKWDDIIFRHKAVRWVWLLIVVIIAAITIPSALAAYPGWEHAAQVCIRILIIVNLMMVTIEMIKSVFLLLADKENIDTIAEQMRKAQENGEEYVYVPSHSLKGLQQMLIIIISAGAAILIISILFGKDPLIIFSGLGAAAAVLMLVFQDSILGVVAGIQITANDMLQPGDWIVVPKYNANGIVREVSLATVKIQNWDKSIVTIQPYKLISEGFQNWRGMQDGKGRRIARSLLIDTTTVRRGTAEESARWRDTKWGASLGEGEIVNLTALRAYLEHRITIVPTFIPTMLYMVRELQPTPQGLPLEIYFFTSNIEWKKYEHVQADLFDEIIATINEFGLRLYQAPAGYDFSAK